MGTPYARLGLRPEAASGTISLPFTLATRFTFLQPARSLAQWYTVPRTVRVQFEGGETLEIAPSLRAGEFRVAEILDQRSFASRLASFEK
jgi:hypothetical protein